MDAISIEELKVQKLHLKGFRASAVAWGLFLAFALVVILGVLYFRSSPHPGPGNPGLPVPELSVSPPAGGANVVKHSRVPPEDFGSDPRASREQGQSPALAEEGNLLPEPLNSLWVANVGSSP